MKIRKFNDLNQESGEKLTQFFLQVLKGAECTTLNAFFRKPRPKFVV